MRESEPRIKTETHDVSSGGQKTHFNCEGDCVLAQVAERSDGIPGDIQKLLGTGPGQLALADPVLIGVWEKLDDIIFRGPFHSQPFCDSSCYCHRAFWWQD